ncbi:hypothetical protein SAMN04488005_0078 [Yoonia tamlensis]|uniref:Uncharacterized protein n=1 Tax=Yoonia tamlensis TaxID=390270 RepID=A0A1I6FNK2_9RHOB|nr:hypothetical protein [Yoonia tamlensis]SFR31530.1 hypothetical protein SAMN04488005_0078 [Yoonia tamlensis]
MAKLNDIDLKNIKELFCKGGEEGFRIVHVAHPVRRNTQNYHDASNTIETYPPSFTLEGEGTVNLDDGQLRVLKSNEILVPYRAYMTDKSLIDIDQDT